MDTATQAGQVTDTTTMAGATLATAATEIAAQVPSIEDLQKKLAEAEQRAANKADEAARHYKKVEAFEKSEKERAEAALSKEQLAAKRAAESVANATAEAERVKNEAAQKLAANEAKLLKAAVLLKAKELG